MSMTLDLRYALRLLGKNPRFTALTIGVLAGGLAITLFTFAFLYTILYKPLPLPEQDTLYRASLHWNDEARGPERYFPAYELSEIRSRLTAFKELGAWQNINVHLSQGENARMVSAVRTEWTMFQASRTPPVLGRTLQLSDSAEGAVPVAVISHALWQGQFAGDPAVVGRTMSISGVQTEVVGVMPEGYQFPITHDVWLPISSALLNPTPTGSKKVEVYARLADGFTAEAAEQQLLDLARSVYQTRAAQTPGVTLQKADVGLFQQFDISVEMRVLCFALMGIAVFILLLSSINVGNLLFARAIQRNRESAIRAALGADQWRLVGQLMWEGVIIVFSGTVLAILIAAWLLALVNVSIHSLMQGELAFWYQWEADGAVVAAAVAFSLFTLLVACFVPALRAARQDFNAVLRDGTRGMQGRRVGRISRWLVTAQILAVSFIAVLGTVLSVKIHQLTDLQVGYQSTRLYFSIVDLPEERYPSQETRLAFFDQLNQKLNQQSEYEGAVVRFAFERLPVSIEGVDYHQEADRPKLPVFSLLGTPDFMGPFLIDGRYLDERDRAGGQPAALISESMAKRYFSQGSPLGKRVQIAVDGSPVWHTIVGVVSNVSKTPLERPEQVDEIHLSGYQYPKQRGVVLFKYTTRPEAAENVFFRALSEVDSQLDVVTVEDFEVEMGAITKMTAMLRDTIVFSGLFGLLLAISGIYALTAFAVTNRAREVGVRRALGANDRQIVGLFVRQGGWQLGTGLGLGIILSSLILLALGSFFALAAFTYAVVFSLVIGVLVATVLLAIAVPVRASVAVEPAVTLRYD